VFCKDQFSADLLFPECCHEFNLSKLEFHEEYAAEENTLHHDQETNNPHYDNLSDAFDIVSNASTIVHSHKDQIFLSDNLEDIEQIDGFASDSFRSAKDDEGSLQFSDLQGLSNLQLEHKEDFSSPYKYVIPNDDEKRSEIFPNMFYHPITNPAIT